LQTVEFDVMSDERDEERDNVTTNHQQTQAKIQVVPGVNGKTE
jgi:hypothetical protein